MERLLLAIVSLMVFQIFEALYINCELGSGVIRKASFLFDSKYREYIKIWPEPDRIWKKVAGSTGNGTGDQNINHIIQQMLTF